MDAVIYKKAIVISPDFKKVNSSSENAENVVNPPQKPVTNKKYIGLLVCETQ